MYVLTVKLGPKKVYHTLFPNKYIFISEKLFKKYIMRMHIKTINYTDVDFYLSMPLGE